jgi:hypothetical protein
VRTSARVAAAAAVPARRGAVGRFGHRTNPSGGSPLGFIYSLMSSKYSDTGGSDADFQEVKEAIRATQGI